MAPRVRPRHSFSRLRPVDKPGEGTFGLAEFVNGPYSETSVTNGTRPLSNEPWDTHSDMVPWG